MGFHKVAPIAHGTTWAMLLAGLDKDVWKRAQLQIDWPLDTEPNLAIRFLPLLKGGAVFVLTDNIHVFTQSEAAATAWQNHIIFQTNRFNATLKDPTHELRIPKDEQNFVPNEAATAAPVMPILHPTPRSGVCTKAEFSGVRFSSEGISVVNPPHQTGKVVEQQWSGTYRQLASVMSQCLWSCRVRQQDMLADDKDRFMQLYSRARPTKAEKWSSETELGVADTLTLQTVFLECVANKPVPYLKPLEQPRSIGYLCTDARGQSQDGAPLPPGTPNTGYCFAHEISAATAIPFNGWGIHHHDDIGLGELSVYAAAIDAYDEASDVGKLPKADAFVLTSDSKSAIGRADKLWATKAEARDELRRLKAKLRGRQLRLVFVRSALNPTDRLSRGESFDDGDLVKWRDLVTGPMESAARTLKLERTALHVDPTLPARRERP